MKKRHQLTVPKGKKNHLGFDELLKNEEKIWRACWKWGKCFVLAICKNWCITLTTSPDINWFSVWILLENFRREVTWRSGEAEPCLCFTLYLYCKPKIGKFYSSTFCFTRQKQIFWLQENWYSKKSQRVEPFRNFHIVSHNDCTSSREICPSHWSNKATSSWSACLINSILVKHDLRNSAYFLPINYAFVSFPA